MDFLVRRPIAVIMAFLAFVIIGVITYRTLPISLLPDIAIPEITIQATDATMTSQEMEKSVIQNLRRQMLQVNGLENIKSEVRDGIGIIQMKFKYGTNTDYAYIEVNEKIDGAMNYIPQGVSRPKAIKASATDIPVFYLNIALKNGVTDATQFQQMCDAVENVIRRRIEQLPEVAMADMTGVPSQCLMVTPDLDKMQIYGVEINHIENALNNNNISPSSMRVIDGIFEYTIKMSTLLRDKSDVEDIYIRCGERYIQLKDICKIEITSKEEQGYSYSNGRRVVTLAVIKQADEGMDAMRLRIKELVDQFEAQFPNLDFEISRNQTELLDYTISNLKQNLILGFILIIAVAMLFMGGARTSVTIGISMIVSVIITFVVFYLCDKSLNIISLSGLILVVGMMIDNALIISENIAQWQQRGSTLRVSCVGATREMITPLLSSSLTTIAVFVPLIFIQGIGGTLFSDQAFAITAGLGVSYIVGIILLPVIYHQFLAAKIAKKGFVAKNNLRQVSYTYDKGFNYVMRNKNLFVLFVLMSLPLCWLMFNVIDKNRMPELDYNELTAKIEWDSEISVQQNRLLTEELLASTQASSEEQSAYIGVQDFIVDESNELSQTEAQLYWRFASPDSIESVMNKVLTWVAINQPNASVSFAPPMTIFEKIFDTSDPDLVAEISTKMNTKQLTTNDIKEIESKIKDATKDIKSTTLQFKNIRNIIVNREALELYHVDISHLQRTIQQAVVNTHITTLHSYNSYLPVCIASSNEQIDEFIKNGSIYLGENTYIPIRQLVSIENADELKTITAGKNDTYIPICFYEVSNSKALCKTIDNVMSNYSNCEVNYSGEIFESQATLSQLVIILIISLLLMYFILCAQFESFRQPLIVLIEIPIDTAFALVILWLCGETLNLMSGIGIIVSCGIIVNDSILKLDTINELRKKGMPLIEAIHTAGHRRLRAIVMTSLTTIGAMLPILFTNDMGSELQQPLAVAMIATMTIGTIVSLFIIPLIYSIIERKTTFNN